MTRTAGVASLTIVTLLLVACGCTTTHKTNTPPAKPQGEADKLARAKGAPLPTSDKLELVATFHDQMLTGVAVAPTGRIFVNYPRWGGPVKFTVAEIVDGKEVPYPSLEMNQGDKGDADKKFVSVQSVVVDPAGRLWVVDTGSVEFGPVPEGAAKLMCYDLSTNQLVRTIPFPRDVVRPNSYTNDIRFDLSRGTQGMAYLTDSSVKGDNGLIVVDLASGKSWRRLDKHPSTLPEPGFKPVVEGETLMERPPTGDPKPLTFGSDGIAIPSGGKLYFCPLAGHHLYSVSLDALSDPNATEAQVAATVQDLGDRGFASDGLDGDAQGRIYLTDYEHNAVLRRDAAGHQEFLVQDPRLIWPDSMAIAPDGYVYVTANQLNRQAKFHKGQDLRQKPYALFRIKTDAKPVQQPVGR